MPSLWRNCETWDSVCESHKLNSDTDNGRSHDAREQMCWQCDARDAHFCSWSLWHSCLRLKLSHVTAHPSSPKGYRCPRCRTYPPDEGCFGNSIGKEIPHKEGRGNPSEPPKRD
eukprot:2398688-Amphidinium_carterae.1